MNSLLLRKCSSCFREVLEHENLSKDCFCDYCLNSIQREIEYELRHRNTFWGFVSRSRGLMTAIWCTAMLVVFIVIVLINEVIIEPINHFMKSLGR